jgi:succinate dehydrogenase flavin-adding protein (antitoxin of CptAB toxin-antitoxin module)
MNWINGINLIKDVSITVGGDNKHYWYCKNCNKSYKNKIKVCKNKIRNINRDVVDKFMKLEMNYLSSELYSKYDIIFDPEDNKIYEFIDEKIELELEDIIPKIAEIIYECEYEGGKVFYYTDCNCSEFEYLKKEGQVIQNYDREYMNLWVDILDTQNSKN